MKTNQTHPATGQIAGDKAEIRHFDNGRYLVNFSDVGKKYDSPILNNYSKEIVAVTHYLHEDVSKTNRELGRSGMVCPYTHGALKKSNMYFTIYPDDLWDCEKGKKLVLDYVDIFMKISPTEGFQKFFKSFIILLPEVKNHEAHIVVEKVQNQLKSSVTGKGIMLGQFYPGCESQGVHNKDFRPLRSPIPMLVIRYMVKTDYVFLENHKKEYFSNFGNEFDPAAISFYANKTSFNSGY